MTKPYRLKQFPELYRAKINCQVGRKKLEDLDVHRPQDHAMFCLLNAVGEIAAHLMKEDTLLTTCCDQPDDRMFHAADKTWWKRVGNRWEAAGPPNQLSKERTQSHE